MAKRGKAMDNYGPALLVERELASFAQARDEQSPAYAWIALERAHILAQGVFALHGRVHFRMLRYAYEQRDAREVVGQLLRLALVPVGRALQRLPVGNTGRANVSAFAPMPLPADLAADLRSSTLPPRT